MTCCRLVRAGVTWACAAALSGCLYVKPGWVPTNDPPDIHEPVGYEEGPIPYVLDRNIALPVLASDPEMQLLTFTWVVDVPFDLEPTTPQQVDASTWLSVQNVPPDPELYGALISVFVRDGVNTVTVRFEMLEPTR